MGPGGHVGIRLAVRIKESFGHQQFLARTFIGHAPGIAAVLCFHRIPVFIKVFFINRLRIRCRTIVFIMDRSILQLITAGRLPVFIHEGHADDLAVFIPLIDIACIARLHIDQLQIRPEILFLADLFHCF